MNGKFKLFSLGVMAVFIAAASPFVLKIQAVSNTADAADSSSATFSDGQKKELETVVHDYILAHPEVLMESVNKYRDNQGKEQEAKAGEALKAIGNDLFKNASLPEAGPKSGDVTVVEFFDYNCGYCKKGFESVQEALQKDKKVRFVFVDFPILSPESHTASQYALAADKQGKYFEYHKALMSFQGPKTEENIMKLSKEAGLDIDKLKTDFKSPDIEAQLKKNQEMAEKLAISGTPAFIVGDQIIRGYVPYDAMKTLIDQQRKKSS